VSTPERKDPVYPLRGSKNLNADEQPRRFERVLLALFVLTLPLVNPIVHGDGVGYYAYARAPLIQHNLNFDDDWRHANPNFSGARVGADGQVYPEEYTVTGHVNNLFSVGPAILWWVFLIPAHAAVLLYDALGGHVAANGFSFPYILAMALGTAVYGFLGLLLAFSLARKYVEERWAFLATLGVWFGSSLPVYMYFNPAWSHAHSAFTVGLFLWYWERTRPQRSMGQWAVLGLIAGLMIDVYFPNGVLLLLPLVESLKTYTAFQDVGFARVRLLFNENLLFVAAILFAALPTFITRKIVFGGYLNFGSYAHQDWDWSAPFWKAVLFSSDHGLISWTPLLGFALIGLAFCTPPARGLVVYMGVGFLAFFYLIASYPYWDGLSSFGNRFFISLSAIYVFGLAMLLGAIGNRFRSSRLSFALLASVLGCLVVWNFGFIFQWGAHLIPVRGPISWHEMVTNQFEVVPRETAGYFRKFIFRRSDLMRQIEERDKEQQRRNLGQ
jgi:hypothetical protein